MAFFSRGSFDETFSPEASAVQLSTQVPIGSPGTSFASVFEPQKIWEKEMEKQAREKDESNHSSKHKDKKKKKKKHKSKHKHKHHSEHKHKS